MANSEVTVSGALAKSFCEQYPEASTLSLARKLYKEHRKVYSSLETARTAVRYYRGEHGTRSRSHKNCVGNSQKRTYAIPPSDAEPVTSVKFNHSGSGIVISDLHIPYHDVRAIETMLDHATQKNLLDFCIIDGDFLDCYSLSRWCKDPRKRCFASEIEYGKQMLDLLTGMFKVVWYKLGNHEVRYEHYLYSKAAELLGVPDFELDRLLKLEDKKVRFVKANRVIEAGKLNILHGHEYPGGITSPVNPARGMFTRANACTISGHQHQTSQHHQPNIRGELVSCWSIGCLCGLSPEYAPLNKWNHGFAELTFDGKWFEVNTRRILDGRVV